MLFGNKTPKRLGLSFLILITVLVVLATITLLAEDAEAGYPDDSYLIDWGENWHPSRGEVRLNLLGEFSKGGLKSRLQGVCYDVLEKDNKPYYLYLGIGLQIGNLEIEPTVGWSFRTDEPVAALRLYPEWENWRGYSNFEYELGSRSFYYLNQLETSLNDLVEWGVEAESWGDIDDNQWSNGFGLNLIVSLPGARLGDEVSKFRFEAAIQFRELGDQWKPQAVVRFSITPKLEDHTPDRSSKNRRFY